MCVRIRCECEWDCCVCTPMLWSDCKSVFHLVRTLAHCNGTFGRELLRSTTPLLHSHPQPGRCISAHYCKTDLCVYTAHFCVGLMVVLRTFGNTQTIRDGIYILLVGRSGANFSMRSMRTEKASVPSWL